MNMGITLIICASIIFIICMIAFTVLVLTIKERVKPDNYENKILDVKVELATEMADAISKQKIADEKTKYLNTRIKELTENNLALVQHNTTLNALNKELESKQINMVAKRKAN